MSISTTIQALHLFLTHSVNQSISDLLRSSFFFSFFFLSFSLLFVSLLSCILLYCCYTLPVLSTHSQSSSLLTYIDTDTISFQLVSTCVGSMASAPSVCSSMSYSFPPCHDRYIVFRPCRGPSLGSTPGNIVSRAVHGTRARYRAR